MKKIYTNNNFIDHWPVGTAAVVRASSPEEAAEILNAKIREMGLPRGIEAKDMILFDHAESVRVLCDGDY